MPEFAAPMGHDDSIPEPTVEREQTPDGRYVLYFSWPDGSPDGDRDEASATDE